MNKPDWLTSQDLYYIRRGVEIMHIFHSSFYLSAYIQKQNNKGLMNFTSLDNLHWSSLLRFLTLHINVHCTKTVAENWDSKRHLLELSWSIQRLRLRSCLFQKKNLFCFSRRKFETFSICLKKNFVNELKLCEISRKFFSNKSFLS